jgi:hypothetical protein
MGANPYFYFTPYQENIQRALDQLREQEFRAGHYDPVLCTAAPYLYMFEMQFPPDEEWPSPGAQHATIEEAVEAGMESGTNSILDLFQITRESEFFSACPVPDADLLKLFGTTKPTRAQVEGVLARSWLRCTREAMQLFWDRIERGHGCYIVVHADTKPSELFFAGMSVD